MVTHDPQSQGSAGPLQFVPQKYSPQT